MDAVQSWLAVYVRVVLRRRIEKAQGAEPFARAVVPADEELVDAFLPGGGVQCRASRQDAVQVEDARVELGREPEHPDRRRRRSEAPAQVCVLLPGHRFEKAGYLASLPRQPASPVIELVGVEPCVAGTAKGFFGRSEGIGRCAFGNPV